MRRSSPRPARWHRAGVLWLSLSALLLGLLLHAALAGAIAIPPGRLPELLAAGLAGGPAQPELALWWQVLLELRLPRALLACAVGAALACSGAAMQGLFRNPLADPGLIGVSAGAALAAALAIVAGGAWALPAAWQPWLLPLAAASGGALALAAVLRLASHGGRTAVATLLLMGVAVNAIAGTGIGFLTYLADDRALRELSFWNLGSLAGANWANTPLVALLALLACWRLSHCGAQLNALALGETDAAHLGVPVEALKRALVGWSAVAVGAAVAFAGIIGFVGLVIPHLLRLLCGPDQRMLLPAAALSGAALLLAADTAARTLLLPAELPVGLITTALGAPCFLFLLLHRKKDIAP